MSMSCARVCVVTDLLSLLCTGRSLLGGCSAVGSAVGRLLLGRGTVLGAVWGLLLGRSAVGVEGGAEGSGSVGGTGYVQDGGRASAKGVVAQLAQHAHKAGVKSFGGAGDGDGLLGGTGQGVDGQGDAALGGLLDLADDAAALANDGTGEELVNEHLDAVLSLRLGALGVG